MMRYACGRDVCSRHDVSDHWRDRVLPPVIENGIENLIGSVHFLGATGFLVGNTGVFQVIFNPGSFTSAGETGGRCNFPFGS